MVFTTRITVSSMYRTSNGVIGPIIGFYFTVVVVVISFSIIVS
jgi:tetrahydromethanopterin S-methyltransferase subunit F